MNKFLCIFLFIIVVVVIVCCNMRGGSCSVYGGATIADLAKNSILLGSSSPKDLYNAIKNNDDQYANLGKGNLALTKDSDGTQKTAFVNYIRGRLYCRASSEEAIRAIESSIRTKDQEITRLQQQNIDCAKELDVLRKKIDELKRERDALKAQLDEMDGRKNIGSQEEIDRLKIEKETLKARIKDLESRINTLEARIRDLEQESDLKEQQITALKDKLNECNDRYARDMNLIAQDTSEYVRFCNALQRLAQQASGIAPKAKGATSGGFMLSEAGFDRQKDRLLNEIKHNDSLSSPERRELLTTGGRIHYGHRANY